MNRIHTLADFTHAPPKLDRPCYGTLLLAPDGHLWGVTNSANHELGSIFKVLPDGSGWSLVDSTLVEPNAGLVSDGRGFLWGTSRGGGLDGESGTVFKVNLATGAVTTVIKFNGIKLDADFQEANEMGHLGACPLDGLVSDGEGFLWGTTSEGGTEDWGTVFKVEIATGILTTLVDFTGNYGTAIGAHPRAGLVADGIGNLWGTTYGAFSDGTIFKVNVTTGSMTVVASVDLSHGRLVNDGRGFLWGTTEGSRIFNVDIASGVMRDVASLFDGLPCSGLEPVAGMVSDGRGFLWGTTRTGGASGHGAVFKVDLATWSVKTVLGFTGNGASNKGSRLIAGLVRDGSGSLWGTTSKGGSSDLGTVFKVDVATGILTTVVEFCPKAQMTRRKADAAPRKERTDRRNRPPSRNSMWGNECASIVPSTAIALRGSIRAYPTAQKAMSQKPEPTSPCHIPDHTLVRVIGRGAYGEVWLAKNVMGTWRAVKIVRRESFTSERPYEREFDGIRKFEPVSRAHSTQVDILHVGRDDLAGLFYYVMELGDDVHSCQEINPDNYAPRTLESELREKQRLPARQCIDIGLALATALEHLHAHGLIHRDIKPSNIIFVHGRPKLADIGLVAEAADAMSFVGTEGYVPIEGPGSSRADIFSLGRVLYEISTGLSQRQFPDIPTSFGLDEDDDELARELNLVINKACSRGADHRHESAAALRDELVLLQSGHSIRRLRDNERRLRVVRWVGAAAVVVAAFSLVGFISARRANVRADANAKTAEAHLAEARLAQARSLHAGDSAGRRAEALAAIAEAARIAPSRALRNEALALLPLADLGAAVVITPYAPDFTPNMRRPLRARLSPDGEQCAWALDRDFVLITNTSDGREVARLPFKGVYGRALEWSPGGRYLAAYSQKKVVVWDWPERKETINHDIERSDAGSAAAFSANDERVVLCLGTRVGVFECASGKEIAMVERDQRQTAFAIHPDGDLFGMVGPGSATLWHATSKLEVLGRELPKGAGGNLSFRQVAWSRDGKLVAAALTDGTLLMYSYDSGKVVMRVGHVGVPGNIAFSPDSSLLISASADDGTRLWDVRGGLLRVASIPDAFGLQFAEDSQSIVFATSRGLERRPIIRQPGLFFAVNSAGHRMEMTAISPDGRLLAAMGDKHSSIDLWDTQSGRRLGVMGGLFGGDRELGWLGFSRDGGTLLAVGNTGVISSSIAFRDATLSQGWLSTKALPAACEPGDAGDTSPDGKLLAVRVNGNLFFVCDPANPTKARSVTIESGRVVGLSWSADSKSIAVSNSQSPPVIIDAATLKQTHVLGERSGKAVFSPAGKVLALASAVSCEILDATTFQLLKSFPHSPLESSSDEIVFSGDGKFLAMTQEGRRVDLIELARLENVATLEPPPSSRANRLLFSPDGSTLVLHDADNAYFYNIPALRRELVALGLDW